MARPLSDDARAKMITAAQEVIGERGVDGFTVDEVARRSGVAKTTIYRHFNTGDALVLGAIDDLVEAIPVPDTGALRSDLREVIAAFMSIGGVPELHRLLTSVLNRAAHNPDFAALHRELMLERHKPMRVVIERAQERGEIESSIPVDLAVSVAEGPFTVRRLFENRDVSETELEQLLDLVIRALAPPG